mmetsp:Transcript_5319/g.12830  ORF Transcript_5319/g.12830 Transcript_5319/m.12830 type:complete len:200 (-) Transcript_5319:46-645(-)
MFVLDAEAHPSRRRRHVTQHHVHPSERLLLVVVGTGEEDIAKHRPRAVCDRRHQRRCPVVDWEPARHALIVDIHAHGDVARFRHRRQQRHDLNALLRDEVVDEGVVPAELLLRVLAQVLLLRLELQVFQEVCALLAGQTSGFRVPELQAICEAPDVVVLVLGDEVPLLHGRVGIARDIHKLEPLGDHDRCQGDHDHQPG